MPVKRTFIPVIAAAAVVMLAGAVQAATLENLERERGIVIEALLDPSLTPRQRQDKIAVSKRRLVDLERMVLRDKSLAERNDPVVRKAFDNYDLTFLIHASVEKNSALIDHWLQQVGVSTHTLMNARLGRR
ncbi:MAG: hypothetical protein CMF63_02255 [Magnetovibrio sp.]|jgi:hypothetical protein|nr:hypothetical protein [Magnetovibrio sp.]|tara:strand:- start:122 stop:514 length:393 start_codon:yes stop_codon:yes gene_type:complete